MHESSSDCARASTSGDAINAVIDAAYRGHISRRRVLRMLLAAGVSAAVERDMAEQAAHAQANQAAQLGNLKAEPLHVLLGQIDQGDICYLGHLR